MTSQAIVKDPMKGFYHFFKRTCGIQGIFFNHHVYSLHLKGENSKYSAGELLITKLEVMALRLLPASTGRQILLPLITH